MRRLFLIIALAVVAGLNPIAQGGPVLPIDPQRGQDQEEMTWNDYRPIPGANWSDPKPGSARNFRVALIAVDSPDQPFGITLPKTSDLFGNPQTHPVKRDDVPRFYADFWGRAERAESRPHDSRVLDGAVARPGGHPHNRWVRPVSHAEEPSVTVTSESDLTKATSTPTTVTAR